MERVVFIWWKKVSLSIPEERDLEIMYRWINNINISQYLAPIRTISLNAEKEYLEKQMEHWKHFFVITENENQWVIGGIGFHDFDERARRAEIWISLYKEEFLWRWFGTEAMSLIQKYAFEYIGLHKLTLKLFWFNKRAYASYIKSWFQEVGRLKDHVYTLWWYHDEIIMEIMRSEYEKIKR